VTGKTLKTEDIIKGYQYEPGQYVIVDQEDFDKVKLKSEKVIEIKGFVDASEVQPTLFEAPYYIGPDGDVAAKTYGLLMETLRHTNKLGVGTVVLRDRETPLLLAPHDKGIVMYRLRYPNEVKDIGEVPLLKEVKADKTQLKLAQTLVDSMSMKFTDIEMKDNYTDKLKQIIEAKIEGKEVVIVEEEAPKVVDIMTALKASIDAAKKKPMEKAKGEKATKAKAEKPAKTARRKAS
jgi:DNA end-binding protein Ku